MAQLEKQIESNLKIIWAEKNESDFLALNDCYQEQWKVIAELDYKNDLYQSIFITSNLEIIKNKTVKTKYIIYLADEIDILALNEIQKKSEKFFIYKKNELQLQKLQELQESFLQEYKKEKKLKELSQQNKKLEKLTGNLEELIAESTQDIQISTNEEKNKSSHIKNVIHFLNELPNFYSVEELLNRVRVEFKKFHKIGDLFLVFKNAADQAVMYSTRAGVVNCQFINESSFQSIFNSSDAIEKKITEIVKRPVIKIMTFPIRFDLINVIQENKKNGFLFIENNLNEQETFSLQEYFKEIIESFNSHLEKILIEDHLSIFSYRWEKTFDAINSPIAIIDSEYRVLRSNKKFSTLNEKFKINLQIKNDQLQIENNLYQVHSFPIQFHATQIAMNFVNYYVDITANQELKIKNAMSEKMVAIGDLAGNIAHELNNPLSGLRSLAQVLIQETPKGSQIQSDLIEIEKAAARSQNIIKNLLDFSSGEEKNTVFNLDEVVQSTLPFCKTTLRYLRSQVLLNTPSTQVFGNPHLLQQVVFNLINNASHAMGKEGQLIIKSWKESRGTQEYVILSIKDNGPGISKANLKKIFDAFYTTKSAGQGAGLGLSISKSIIEKMKGTLECDSILGEGAEFKINLPVYIYASGGSNENINN